MPERAASTDAEVLRGAAYRTGDNLRDRASIYQYRTEPFDLHAWVLDRVEWPAGARTLDVGCGPGLYGRRLLDRGARVSEVDLSEGMVREATTANAAVLPTVASAMTLPFTAGAFDRVLAAHMLYHLPAREAGAAELARVLAVDGAALVVTNGARHLGGLRDAMGTAGGIGTPVSENFLLDEAGAAVLETAFGSVDLLRHVGRIEVPDAGPVLRYAESCRALDEPAMTMPWHEMIERFSAAVADEIARTGHFAITTDTGVFVCTEPHV